MSDPRPLEFFTFDELFSEIYARTEGAVLAYVVRLDNQSETYDVKFKSRTLAIGILERAKFGLLYGHDTPLDSDQT